MLRVTTNSTDTTASTTSEETKEDAPKSEPEDQAAKEDVPEDSAAPLIDPVHIETDPVNDEIADETEVPEPHRKVITVHVVPHSHMDTGWERTYDEYYDIYVKRIFHSVVKKLT